MSNKSGISEQIISLPKGGGALQGIGEKFSPDLFTGTGNFTVPIALPSGRNGFQPELNLAYSTGNSNSPFGLGWGLSIPGVSRQTAKGVPRYDDDTDTFILSGAEDLVPVNKSESKTQYRPRTEGLFARIIHRYDSTNDYWEVCSKDGLVSYYGIPGAKGNDPATVTDPDNRTKIFNWKLSLTQDPFGNRIEYEYDRNLEEDSSHHWDQLYLRQIRYIDYTSDNGETNFLISVIFLYEDRPDPYSAYRAGFEIRTTRRCTAIETHTHADRDQLVRSYHLIYLDRREDFEYQGPLNGTSLLSQIKVVGHDEDRTEELPPLEFGYTRFKPEERDFFPIKGHLPSNSLANPGIEQVDLFGNGLPDIIEMNGTVRYWRNLGNGRFDLPREMRAAPAGVTLADEGVQMIDANGNGRADLLVTTKNLSGYFPLRFGGYWDRKSFRKYKVAPSFNLEDPEVRLVDLDGDGVTDAIRSGTRLECFFNDPQEGWNNTRWVERRSVEDFPNINFSDPRVKWGDMSGDGLQDILLVYDGNVEYWPNLGYGNWGKRIHMRNSPRFPDGYDPKRILVGDVDGDGLADIVYVGDNQITLWINQSGNSWSNPIEIKGTPPVSDMDAVRLADMLGSGISGVLWSYDYGSVGRDTMYFHDFTNGLKPYLLCEMDNHMGAITRVEYTSSTQFYQEDEKQPETRWKTPLPFPVQVVSRVEVIDAISGGKLTTEYSYHHGYWDGAEREFHGFGRVDQRDTEVFERYHEPNLHPDKSFEAVDEVMFSPPLETRTWFHQGPVGDEFGEWEESDYSHEYWQDDPNVLTRPIEIENFIRNMPDRRVRRDILRTLRGRILRTELYALDGSERQERPYTVTENLHGVAPLPVGENLPAEPAEWQQQVFFPHSLAQRVTQWERGSDPMTRFSFTDNYDQYGQPRSQIGIAIPRQHRFLESVADTEFNEPYLATHSISSFAQRDDDTCFIVARLAQVTSYEVINDGRPSVFQLVQMIRDDILPKKIIGQAVNFYDGDAFTGLPYGEIGDYGALVRTETLVLTEDIINEAWPDSDDIPTALTTPPYFAHTGSPVWSDEYPEAFRNMFPTDDHDDPTRPGLTITPLGYGFSEGGSDSPFAWGYFTATLRQCFDFHHHSNGRGLLTAIRDRLGRDDNRDTSIEYDSYQLLPILVTDLIGLTTHAEYDDRTLQPQLVTDPNGNRTANGFTPLGLLEYTAIMGKEGEHVGDTQEAPGARMNYDFLAYLEREQPISVRSIRRVYHTHDSEIELPERDETIESIEYSDGFGRLLQTRTQGEDVMFGDPVFGGNVLPVDQTDTSGTMADVIGRQRNPDDPPNVVVSGWQIYNNKGKVIQKYEPFYSICWEYTLPLEHERGQKVTMYYDPRGQVIRTVNPNGSEQQVIFGVPGSIAAPDIAIPDTFEPTPWESYSYDENDSAGRTHPTEATTYEHHWNTPANTLIDALGRTILSVERNRNRNTDGTWSPIEEYRTRSTYDIRGNLLTVTDALDREAFRYVYDLTPKQNEEDEGAKVLRIWQLDGGIRRMILDAAGNEIERRDSKGALILRTYDILYRPIRMWARDNDCSAVTLRECLEYGDGGNREQALSERTTNRDLNLLGKLTKHYDEAGLLTFDAYDFKDNLLEKGRLVINDESILSVFPTPGDPAPDWNIQPFRVDWQPPDGTTLADHAENLLEAKTYQTSMTYDALNRITKMIYPEDVDGERKVLEQLYNRAGALEQIELDDTTYVQHIAYDAKGQRTLIVYGNGIMTRYAYDPHTFRLARMRSERFSDIDTYGFRPRSSTTPEDRKRNILQDYGYVYDLASNILQIRDRTPESGVPDTLFGKEKLDRDFIYDPINRLIHATGRECDTLPPSSPWDDTIRCQDVTATRLYSQTYTYDAAGNMQQLKHTAERGSFTRNFEHVPGRNQLQQMRIGTTHYDYLYDPNGNMSQEYTNRYFEWDHSDRMRAFRNQVSNSEPTVYAHYLYDSGGQRIKKIIRKQGGQSESTVYADRVFEYHFNASETIENNTLHVMDAQKLIAFVRVGEPFRGDYTPTVKYILGDHLESCNLIIDTNNIWINREEYTPFGENSYGSYSMKRYHYCGKERDKETELYYYGARYFSSYLCRWISCEPFFKFSKEIDTNSRLPYLMNQLNLINTLNTEKLIDNMDFNEFANINWNTILLSNTTSSILINSEISNNVSMMKSFAYVDNRPLLYVDPDGRWPWVAVVISGLIVIEILQTVVEPIVTQQGPRQELTPPNRFQSRQDRMTMQGPGAHFENRQYRESDKAQPEIATRNFSDYQPRETSISAHSHLTHGTHHGHSHGGHSPHTHHREVHVPPATSSRVPIGHQPGQTPGPNAGPIRGPGRNHPQTGGRVMRTRARL